MKNVTAAYRLRLDEILSRRPEYARSSSGSCHYTFTPQLDKSFSRGFTHYFLQGRGEEVASFDTPKSLGEEMGTLKEQRGNSLTVAGVKPFHNGDGVCYLDGQGRLQGFRVNRVVDNRIFPAGEVPRIPLRTRLYRNFDQEFEKLLARKSAERRIALRWSLWETSAGFALSAEDEDGNRATCSFVYDKEPARSPQDANLRVQLGKLGQTPFEAKGEVEIRLSDNWFLPSSVVTDWRRQVVERLLKVRRIRYRREWQVWKPTAHPFPVATLTYLGNVMNAEARRFYLDHGVSSVAPAYEAQAVSGAVLMFCRHCLRYSMGWCPTHQKGRPSYREPYYLVAADGRRFRLSFDCKLCQMKVYAAE